MGKHLPQFCINQDREEKKVLQTLVQDTNKGVLNPYHARATLDMKVPNSIGKRWGGRRGGVKGGDVSYEA